MGEQDNKLVDNCKALHELAERKYKNEGMKERTDRLSQLYDVSRFGPDSSIAQIEQDTLIKVNKIFPRVRVFVSSLYAKRPTIFAKPNRQEDVDSASKSELFLNYVSKAKRFSHEIRLCLTHSGLFHFGCMKLGMDSGKNALPWIEAHHPASVRVDPTLESFEPNRGRWCEFKYWRTFNALRISRLYEEEAIDEAWKKSGTNSESSRATEGIWIRENYIFDDNDNLHVITVAQDSDSVLRNEPFTDVIGLPLRCLVFAPSFDRFFPVSIAEQIIDQQKEINKLRSQQIIHAERSNRFFTYNKQAIDFEDIPKLESDEALKFVPVNQSVRDAVGVVDAANMTADVYNVEMRVADDMMETYGVGSASMGGQERQPSRSATEATIIENNLRMRANDYQEVFEEWLAEVYQGVLSLAQDKLSSEMQVKITEGMWVTLTKEDIKGDVDVSLSFGSTLPTDREAEWARAKEMLEMFRGDPEINQQKLKRFVLDKEGDLKDTADWLVQQMPMMPPGMPGGMPGGPPMGGPGLGDPAAIQNMMAMEAAQNNTPPLQAAGQMRRMIGGQ